MSENAKRGMSAVASLSPLTGVFFGILFSSLTILGVLGNFLVIIAISSDEKMRACVMNILLLNLAIADVSNVIVAAMEWSPLIFFRTTNWLFPTILCPLARYVECVFLYTSITTQLVVCLEKYIATVYPIHAGRLCDRRHALLAVACSWTASAVFALPYALTNMVMPASGNCHNDSLHADWWLMYKFTEFLLYFFLPCTVILILYSRVAAVLWDLNPRLKTESGGCDLQSAKRLATRRSVVKMLVTCAIVYFLCYSPIQALFLSRLLLKMQISLSFGVVLFLNALTVTCSASNPILYALFSIRFRKKLRDLLTTGINKSLSPLLHRNATGSSYSETPNHN